MSSRLHSCNFKMNYPFSTSAQHIDNMLCKLFRFVPRVPFAPTRTALALICVHSLLSYFQCTIGCQPPLLCCCVAFIRCSVRSRALWNSSVERWRFIFFLATSVGGCGGKGIFLRAAAVGTQQFFRLDSDALCIVAACARTLCLTAS